ncbi:MAG: phosphate signaling complex protein PhoU [Methylococcales bacterium]
MAEYSLEGHTVRRFDGELSQLHLLVLEMGGLVQNQLIESLRALKDLDVEGARKITTTDRKVDQLESKVDRQVLTLAARRAPLGRDLRLVIVVSKCVTELEQAGDEAVNIAMKTLHLCSFEGIEPSRELISEIGKIAEQSVDMMRAALTAYDLLDEVQADRVIENHHDLELKFQNELHRLVSLEVEDPRIVSQLVDIALIAKSLESIGRHAKTIAEHVIFYIRGDDVRHSDGSN